MKRSLLTLLAVLALGLSLSCGTVAEVSQATSNENPSAAGQSQVFFEDHTREIVSHAERLIAKNEREGAVLDQKWYGFRRFSEYQELFLGAEKVLFYGGLEADVHSHIRGQYLSVTPLEENQDPGELRLFAGRLDSGKWDCIVVGQNGREVALKTIIRFLYMARFADEDIKRKHRARLASFSQSLKVFMSPLSPRSEYLIFFKRYGIRNLDAVVIGFMGDSSSVLGQMGFERPETFSDESLRGLWYPNVNGKRVLLISINGNRIFASRCRDLIQALYDVSPDSRPLVMFLGSAGAIDAPELVGKIVAPTSVMNGDPFPRLKGQGALIHLIRNRAAELVRLQSIHASVESVVVETTEWAKHIKSRQVKTVDQELYHVIDGINSSPRGAETEIYAAVLATDNVSTDRSANELTLEEAEKTIADTAELRQDYLLKVFRKKGILKDSKQPRAIPQLERKTGTSDR
jgi:hypothetical protein